MRNKKGWLTAESLTVGEREQYAVERSYATVIVELFHDRDEPRDAVGRQQWVVKISVFSKKQSLPSSIIEYRAYRLDAARNKFKQLQKQHP